MTGHRFLRLGLRAAVLLTVLLVIYLGVTFVQVWSAARDDDAVPAEAIVVLGAAQYDGRPSPVLQARLDHVVELWEQGLSDRIVVTGGRRPGDRFTEAEASANYLQEQGVPGGAIEREVSSTNSWESLAAAARFLREDGIREVLLVSDPYHSFRLEGIADELGLDAHVSPTGTSPLSATGETRALLRETAAVSVGRIIGYHRLMRLDDAVGRVRQEAATSYRDQTARSGVV